MTKKSRQDKILELVRLRTVDTQETLKELLEGEGFKVTQATLSKDIRELKLFKTKGADGKHHYRGSEDNGADGREKYVRVLREGLISMDTAGNLLVVHTMSGMANALAAALDQLHFEKLVGTLAGDDTIMCALKEPKDAMAMLEKIQKLVKPQ